MHEHAAHLGGLIGAAHPALDAGIGAAGGALAGQIGGQVAGAKTDERIVGVERGDDQLADLAFGHGVSRAGAHDFYDHAFVEYQSFTGRGFIGNQAQISRAIALIRVNPMVAHPRAQRGRKSFAADHGLGQTG